MPAAAVVGQEADQVVDSVDHGMTAHKATFLCGVDQTGVGQGLEVEGQVRRLEFKLLRNDAGSQAGGRIPDQQAKDGEARFLRQRGQCGDGISFVHFRHDTETLPIRQSLMSGPVGLYGDFPAWPEFFA